MESVKEILHHEILQGLEFSELPPRQDRCTEVPHAPKRNPQLTMDETKQAIRNALRYFPEKWHSILAPEFAEELNVHLD